MECKACGHKNSIWNSETLEVDYKDTAEFLRIEGQFEIVKDLRWIKTTLYACPICGTVRIADIL